MATVATAPGPTVPTALPLKLAGPACAGTRVTLAVPSATAVSEPGGGPPSLSRTLAGGRAQVVGTRDGRAVVHASAVTVVPANGGQGGRGQPQRDLTVTVGLAEREK